MFQIPLNPQITFLCQIVFSVARWDTYRQAKHRAAKNIVMENLAQKKTKRRLA